MVLHTILVNRLKPLHFIYIIVILTMIALRFMSINDPMKAYTDRFSYSWRCVMAETSNGCINQGIEDGDGVLEIITVFT